MADLIKYVPDVLRDIREFKALAECGNAEYNTLWGELNNIRNDLFVDSLTENGASRWETILKIVPKATDTIEVRRFRIKAKLNEQLPYSFNVVKSQLETLCGDDGYNFTVDYPNYLINVRVALTARGMYDEVENLLNRVRPANMVIDLSLLYNQWITLSTKRWSELSTKTWYQLRNEVV